MILCDDAWLEWHEYPLSWSLLSRCPWLPHSLSLTEFPRSSWWILISLYPTLYFIVTGHFTQPVVPLYPLQPRMITIDWTSDEWTTTTKRPRHRLTFKLHAHSHRARPTDGPTQTKRIQLSAVVNELWGISSSLRQRRAHNIHFIRLRYGSCVRWPQSRKLTSIPCWKLMIHWLTLGPSPIACCCFD